MICADTKLKARNDEKYCNINELRTKNKKQEIRNLNGNVHLV